MTNAHIHYGSFKRTDGIDRLIEDQVTSLQEHWSKEPKIKIWLKKIRDSHSKTGIAVKCKIQVKDVAGKSIFVEKMDASLTLALNKARRAILNLVGRQSEKIKYSNRRRKKKDISWYWTDTPRTTTY